MANKDYHVVPKQGGGWTVRQSGSKSTLGSFRTQADASSVARTLAQMSGSERVIHRPNGQIRQKDSYGNDPCPPRDKR